MSSAPSPSQPEQIAIEEELWQPPPKVSFEQAASLAIAKWILGIFGGAYLLCFVMAFVMFRVEGIDYDKATELVKFLLQSIIPLVTLAVGSYLGDRSRQVTE